MRPFRSVEATEPSMEEGATWGGLLPVLGKLSWQVGPDHDASGAAMSAVVSPLPADLGVKPAPCVSVLKRENMILLSRSLRAEGVRDWFTHVATF